MVDITERKLAEARAQHYLDVAGTILLVLRIDQTVELLNRHGRELLGYEDRELIGLDWYDAVVPEEDRRSRRDNFHRVLSGAGEPFTYHQGDVITRTGERRTIAWRNTLLRDPAGEIMGVLPRARTSPSACARRRRSPASPTSTRSPACRTARSSRASCAAASTAAPAPAARWRCCSSTSTTSSSSTTPSATAPATGCCAGSPPACAGSRATAGCWRGSAATSS